MKIFSRALAVVLMLGESVWAVDTVPVPNAAEAPRWGGSAAPNAPVQDYTAPATLPADAARDARPIQSVMKGRVMQAAALEPAAGEPGSTTAAPASPYAAPPSSFSAPATLPATLPATIAPAELEAANPFPAASPVGAAEFENTAPAVMHDGDVIEAQATVPAGRNPGASASGSPGFAPSEPRYQQFENAATDTLPPPPNYRDGGTTATTPGAPRPLVNPFGIAPVTAPTTHGTSSSAAPAAPIAIPATDPFAGRTAAPATPSRSPFPANLMQPLQPALPSEPRLEAAESMPARTANPEIDAAARAAAQAAGNLLEAASVPPKEAGLAEQPLTLFDAIAQARATGRNPSEVVNAYWRLFVATCERGWAADELKQLQTVNAQRGSVEATMLSTARAAAEARWHDAQLTLAAAEEQLAKAIGSNTDPRNQNADQAFAVDRPLVGPYRTHFAELFANRLAPGRAKELDRTLPIRLQSLNDRTLAVQSASSAVQFAEQAFSRGDTQLVTVLACHEELYRQRRAFVKTVFDYNRDIAEYALTVAQPETSTEKLVSMLIRPKATPATASIMRQPANIAASPTFAAPSYSRPAATSEGWQPTAPRVVPSDSFAPTLQPLPQR